LSKQADMSISIIFAMTDDAVIGIDNALPWKLPADMRWFRKHTLGKTILMGRKTFESFGAKPLPERRNIIVTTDTNYNAKGIDIVHSLESGLALESDQEELMVIGGSNIYQQCLPLANRLYMTLVHADIKGDALFPTFDKADWIEQEVEHFEADEKHQHPYSFYVLDRKREV